MANNVIIYGKKIMKIYCILFDACRQNERIKKTFKSKNLNYANYITNSWTTTSLVSLFSGKTPSEMSSMGIGYNDHYKNLSEEEKQQWNKKMIFNQLPEDWKIHIHAIPQTRGDTGTHRYVPDEICKIDRKYVISSPDDMSPYSDDPTRVIKDVQNLSNDENHFIFIKYNHYHDCIRNTQRLRSDAGIKASMELDKALQEIIDIINVIDFEEENSLFWLFADHGHFDNIDTFMKPPDSWLTWVSVTDNITNKKVTKDVISCLDFKNTVLNRVNKIKVRRYKDNSMNRKLDRVGKRWGPDYDRMLPNDVLDKFDEDRIYICEDGRICYTQVDPTQNDSMFHKGTFGLNYCTSVSSIKYLGEDKFIQLVYHSPNKEMKTIIYSNKNETIEKIDTDLSLLDRIKNGVWKWYLEMETDDWEHKRIHLDT